ncbi:MAG: hypothetical protein Q4D41_05625 [Prevotellaceae bacterium]|nr:hypothetical protein [Prevotellaceae bacterium]
MKKLSALICALICILPCIAKEYLDVKTFEFEIKLGTTYPLQHYLGDNKLGADMGLEARWNLKNSPIDVAAELNLCGIHRNYEGTCMTHRLDSYMTFVDYNINRGKKVSVFFGGGVGMCQGILLNSMYGEDRATLTASPRVGVELFRHLRITLTARFAGRVYNAMSLTFGGVIGGGLKKAKM